MARIAGVNIPTNKRVVIALQYIHGIGSAKAREIVDRVGIEDARRVNQLTDQEVLQIREAIDRDYTVEGDLQLVDIFFFAAAIPISAVLAERGRRNALLWVTVAIAAFGLVLAPMFAAGTAQAMAMMALGLFLMGMTYGPLGTVLSELFPTAVRYTGCSLAFNFAGIFGASLAPYIATWLAKHLGLQYVGYYLCAAAVITFCGLLMMPETKDEAFGETIS